jgi:hypothetical protein
VSSNSTAGADDPNAVLDEHPPLQSDLKHVLELLACGYRSHRCIGSNMSVINQSSSGRRRKPIWYDNLPLKRECGVELRRPHQAGESGSPFRTRAQLQFGNYVRHGVPA